MGGHGCEKSPSDCAESGDTDGSDADSCCKAHDRCCGTSDRRSCNSVLERCLADADHSPFSKWCMDGILPVSALTIYAGMKFDPGACCGSSCTAYELSLGSIVNHTDIVV